MNGITQKEFKILKFASDQEVTRMVRDGWQFHHTQFTDAGVLHVLFVRDVAKPTASPAPAATGERLPSQQIIGLDERPWLTHNGRKPGETRPVRVPDAVDPVMVNAFEAGRAVYARVMMEGQAALQAAAHSFNRGQIT